MVIIFVNKKREKKRDVINGECIEISRRYEMADTERCACGGKIVHGHMYGEQFIAGEADLKFAFRGKEQYLSFMFPSGDIPDQGRPAKMCGKCFTITQL